MTRRAALKYYEKEINAIATLSNNHKATTTSKRN
jgi:hypothetical protein